GPSDPHELERFLDQVLGEQLATRHIPGATISVVKDGRLFFAKGYGFANLQHHTPVNAATTLFRIGSVSKLFVWTAVMQLVEQGKLDLHTDVNRYLKTFQIPATYPQPITLANLLTHTAGFEDSSLGYNARTPHELEPLGTWLATHIPARVHPPGQLASYSNYGADLAGYIVEQVSGLSFDQYIEEKIFTPLNMTHSTFRQPVPVHLQPSLSQGYVSTNGVNHVAPFEYLQDAPDGAMSSTATDMANFMLAHLQDGRFGTQRILQETTAREMHAQQFTSDPHLPGIGYGFYEMQINHLHLIGHSGAVQAFHALLALLPAQQMGFFVSYNSSSAGGAGDQLLRAFLDRYFPAPKGGSAPPLLAGFAERANQITGTYWFARRSYTTFEKVFFLFPAVLPAEFVIHISNAGHGHLAMKVGSNTPLNLVEVSPWVFQLVGGTTVVVFQTRPEGTAMLLEASLASYTKVAWYETRTFQYPLLLVCALIFLSAILLWPFQVVRARCRRHADPSSTAARLARWLAGVVCLFNLIIGGTLLVQILTGQIIDFLYDLPPWLVVVFILALVSALLTLGVLLCALVAWSKRWWGTASRIHYTLVALAALVFVLELAYWNLLGFRT
ncbi:MAG TPA: serine hydrolase, partial [Ktedonobacteraceae bacterium]|nr:serine hydrolase [Ktedonobacteraceae bacterium]